MLQILRRGSRGRPDSMEDLMQEARLAFLIHLRKMESLEDVCRCGRDILAAVWSYWHSMAVVYIPRNDYKAVIAGVCRIQLDQDCCQEHCVSEKDAFFPCEYHDFLSSLTPQEQRFVQMKLNGCTGREIMPALKLTSESQASRMLKRVRQKARAYFEQGEEHEHR